MKYIVFDTETSNPTVPWGALAPWHPDSRIHIVSWARGSEPAQAARVTSPEGLKRWITYALTHDVIVAHNLTFDAAYLLASCRKYGWTDLHDRLLLHRWLDTMLLWKRVDKMAMAFDQEEMKRKVDGYGLKKYAAKIGQAYEEGEIDFQSLVYAAKDADITRHLLKWAWVQLDAKQRAAAFDEGAASVVLADSWVQGIEIDTQLLRRSDRELRSEMDVAAFQAKVDPAVLRSDQRRLQWMMSKGFQGAVGPSGEVRRTNGGNLSTDALAMTIVARDHKWAVPVQKFVKAKTMHSKFIEGTKKCLKLTGTTRVHPSPRVAGTYTGRCTYSSTTRYTIPHTFKNGRTTERKKIAPTGVAIHQWPHHPAIRDLIVAPKGHTLVEFDAASQEMRFMALRSGDATMLDIFKRNLKAHAIMAAALSSRTYEDIMANLHGDAATQYKVGKVANLSLQYRTGWKKLCDIALKAGIWMEPEEAQNTSHVYKTTYPGVPRYWGRAVNKAHRSGYAETIGGRRLALPEMGDWRNESAAINFPIQGSGADMKYRAIAETRQLVLQYRARFMLDMHDGLFFVVPDDVVPQFIKDMLHALDNLDYSAWGEIEIPLLWEAKAGKTMGGMN